jgi:hypothetical protein
LRIINNVTDLLGDDLKAEITPGSKVRIAASTFSIFAFEALREELEQVSELEFIFTTPAFVTEKMTDKLRKERREFFIPGGQAESSLSGSCRLGPPQGHVPIERNQQPDAAVRSRWRQRCVHISAGLYHGRPWL